MTGPYTFVIDEKEYKPSSWGPLRRPINPTYRHQEEIWNPDNLKQDAIWAAEAIILHCLEDFPEGKMEVIVMGYIGGEKKEIAFIRGHDHAGFVSLNSRHKLHYRREGIAWPEPI